MIASATPCTPVNEGALTTSAHTTVVIGQRDELNGGVGHVHTVLAGCTQSSALTASVLNGWDDGEGGHLFASLMPGFRDLRAALVAGGLLLGSLYVLLGDHLPRVGSLRPELRAIADLNKAMPTVLAILGCALVGSLYTTALEGVVDWMHRKFLHVDVETISGSLKRRMIIAVTPFSVASRSRLLAEAGRVYGSAAGTVSASWTRTAFQSQVLADVLWLEGKLVGTPLKDPHDQYRSEGELRLATGLLIPLAAGALLYGIHARALWIVVAVIAGVGVGLWQVNYGLYYYRRANSFLAHHIADGTLKTPLMESLH